MQLGKVMLGASATRPLASTHATLVCLVLRVLLVAIKTMNKKLNEFDESVYARCLLKKGEKTERKTEAI